MDYLFSEHLNGSISFNPATDRVIFDNPAILPPDVGPGESSFDNILTTRIEVISRRQAGARVVSGVNIHARRAGIFKLARP
jgi:hypothetical protein